VAGLLLINPDNPTGAVYPLEILQEFVRIARTYGLFIVCDETYANIVYGGARTAMFEQRAEEAAAAFAGIKGISLKKPRGALYATAVFDPGILEAPIPRSLPVSDPSLAAYIREQTAGVAPDKRFVYWLLASAGICVVPLSGFASDLPGFRFTLLEYDDEKRRQIYRAMGKAVEQYVGN
jgi:aspartate/methionine/tyrosine aminotransferase